MSKPAIFIDRDGTLIEDADFLTSPEQIRIMPQAIPGLRRLHDAGYLLVVITNQSAVARGLLSEVRLREIHQKLLQQIELLGGHLDAILYCPHHLEGTVKEFVVDCNCRKPRPGLLLQARDELDVDLDRSFAIGDAWRDVEAALAVGVPTIKVPRPPSREELPRPDLPLLAEARDLSEAADIILSTTALAAREKIAHHVNAAARLRPATDNEADAGAAEAEKSPAESADDPQPFDSSLAASPKLDEMAAASPQKKIDPPPAPTALQKNLFASEAVKPTAAERSRHQRAEKHVCARCGTGLSRDELTHRAALVDGALLCGACLAQTPRMSLRPGSREVAGAPSPPAATTGQPLQEVLAEIRRLLRRQEGESFGFARILGYIAQGLALCIGVGGSFVALAGGHESSLGTLLLAAIFAQLLALTMFLISRNRSN